PAPSRRAWQTARSRRGPACRARRAAGHARGPPPDRPSAPARPAPPRARRPGRGSAVAYPHRMVAEFMTRARDLLAPGVTKENLDQVARLLSEAAGQPGFVTEGEMRSLHGSESSFTILRKDADGLTLMLSRFSPEAPTPVHDHKSWGVACVVRGRDRYVHYEPAPD